MQMEFELPDDLVEEMQKYKSMDWSVFVTQAIQGCISDFTILDKLKEFWGIELQEIKEEGKKKKSK